MSDNNRDLPHQGRENAGSEPLIRFNAAKLAAFWAKAPVFVRIPAIGGLGLVGIWHAFSKIGYLDELTVKNWSTTVTVSGIGFVAVALFFWFVFELLAFIFPGIKR
jgi:hypothetical protein